MRLVIVGEAPSRTSDPKKPLSGPSMRRRLVEFFGEDAYGRAEKRNLLAAYPGRSAGKGAKFPAVEARKAAVALAERFEKSATPRYVVLLGRRVASAFFATGVDAKLFEDRRLGGRSVYAVFPHPSGVNRWFNDPANVRKAKRFGRKVSRA